MQEDFWHIDWEAEFATELSEKELELFDRLAKAVVERRMTVPALMLLESLKPLNWIGSQLMLLLEPISVYIMNFKELKTLRRAFQKRHAMEELARRIEKASAEKGPGQEGKKEES